jgi:serine/threonine protein kinase
MTIREAGNILRSALLPEDVFGELADVESKYRALAHAVHPDHNGSSKKSEDLFKLLQSWKRKADRKIAVGNYGKRDIQEHVIITCGKSEFVVTGMVASGDIAEVYRGVSPDKKDVIIKVARTPKNNDLIVNEYNTLKKLHGIDSSKITSLLVHIPKAMTTFVVVDGAVRKQANVIAAVPCSCTLEDVISAYPDGIDPRDMAWMYNRIMGGLITAHETGYVHGALVPSNILIVPETHNGVIIDWCYSVTVGAKIKALVPKYKSFYPADVLDGRPSSFGVDCHMAAKCALALLGRQARPRVVDGFLNACLLGPGHRPNDVHALFVEFRSLLREIYGQPVFRPFTLPERK